MSFMPGRGRAAWVALFAVLSAAQVVAAGDDKLTVSVVAILASEKNAKVDDRLTEIARHVQKKNEALKGFQMVKETCKDVTLNNSEKFELADGQVVTITVEQAADKDNKNRLKVSPPTLGDITYSTTCGKFLPIITEYKTKDGDVLIIAIRVQPCRDGK